MDSGVTRMSETQGRGSTTPAYAGGAQGDVGTAVEPAARAGAGRGRGGRGEAHGSRRRLAEIEPILEHERRRIAADVHDLIMQDLSFALATARAIAEDPECAATEARAAVLAGERALAGARELLSSLERIGSGSPREAIEAAARTAARGADLSFDTAVPEGVLCDQSIVEVLVHVAREAVTNAVKHAEPSRLAVALAEEGGWLLVVSDDGCGFDTGRHRDGFGLASMTGQAKAAGGRLSVLSAVGAGTVVELVLP